MFDSKTGYPIQNDLESVTIVSDLSIDGDIWTTEAFYQDIDKGIPLIEKTARTGRYLCQMTYVAIMIRFERPLCINGQSIPDYLVKYH